jgi:integrase/recombinase XerD
MTKEDSAPAASASVGLDLACVESFISSLEALGYAACKVRDKRRIAVKFLNWLGSRRIRAGDIGDPHIAQHLGAAQRPSRERWAFKRRVLTAFLRHLRSEHLVPEARPVRENTPAMRLEREYSDYLRDERGLAPRSVLVYAPRVRAFPADREPRMGGPSPRKIDAHAVRTFLLDRIRCCSREEGRLWTVALRSFLRFLFGRSYSRSDLSLSVVMFRRPRAEAVHAFLSSTEVQAILSTPDLSTKTGRRNHAILLLLARLGLRAGEIVTLELDDIHWRVGEVLVRGKGRVHDRLPLPADVGKAVARYVRSARPKSTCRRLFLRCIAPRIAFGGPCAIEGVFRKALASAGLSRRTRIGAHALRHTLATRMIRNGASLPEISQVLRHRSPGTAEIYAKVAFESLREVARQWPRKAAAR